MSLKKCVDIEIFRKLGEVVVAIEDYLNKIKDNKEKIDTSDDDDASDEAVASSSSSPPPPVPAIDVSYNKSLKSISEIIQEIKVLYNNGKFYFSAGENVGALVSYSCATISLNNLKKMLSSFDDDFLTIVPGLKSITIKELKTDINGVMDCCLNVVKGLQGRVQSGSGGAGGNNSKDEKQDWEKQCKKIHHVVFKAGSGDCIFYSDVVGLMKQKDLIDSTLIYPLVYPNLYPKTSKGILIYGPPGTGKTYLVKAAINELQSKDASVGILFLPLLPVI